jgi:hypothetical protein
MGMNRIFTIGISENELAFRIIEAIMYYSDFDPEDPDNAIFKKISRPAKFILDYGCELSRFLTKLTPLIQKDLSKVKFDTENVIYEEDNPFRAEGLGFRTLLNNLTVLGVKAGGDWENPVYFIIYWDGDNLRGYIPKDGNPYNSDTKEAYGNNEESDKANCKKRFGIEDYSVDRYSMWVQLDKVDADIMKRIKKT